MLLSPVPPQATLFKEFLKNGYLLFNHPLNYSINFFTVEAIFFLGVAQTRCCKMGRRYEGFVALVRRKYEVGHS